MCSANSCPVNTSWFLWPPHCPSNWQNKTPTNNKPKPIDFISNKVFNLPDEELLLNILGIALQN